MTSERSRHDEMLEAIDEAEAREQEEEREAVYRRPQRPRDPAQVYSVRVPADRLEQLREIAQRDGVSTSALVRRLVIDGIERRLGDRNEIDALAERVVLLEASMTEFKKDYETRSDDVVEMLRGAVSVLKREDL